MGLFDYFFRGRDSQQASTANVKKASGSQESEGERFTKLMSERLSGWTDEEKALLLAVLVEISDADGHFDDTEQSVLCKKLFEVGVLEDVMHIQSLASTIYEDLVESDERLEKIASDFNKLSSTKKDYIINSASEIMRADGVVTIDELMVANKLTGEFGERIEECMDEMFQKTPNVDDLFSLEDLDEKFPGNFEFDKWICVDGSEVNDINRFKELVRIHLCGVLMQKIVLEKVVEKSGTEAFIETYDNRKIYDWFPLKQHLSSIRLRRSEPGWDIEDTMIALEAIRACVFDFGQMNCGTYTHLIASFLFQEAFDEHAEAGDTGDEAGPPRKDEIDDEEFLKAYRLAKFESLTNED